MSGTMGRSLSKSKGKGDNGQTKGDGGTMSFVGSGHVTASGMLAGGLGPMTQHPVNLNLSLSALSNGKISKASLSATNAAGVATTLDMNPMQQRSGSVASSKQSQQQHVLDQSSAAQRQAAQLTMKKNLQRSGSMQLQGPQGQQQQMQQGLMQQGQQGQLTAQQQSLQRSQSGPKKAAAGMQAVQAQQAYAQPSPQQQGMASQQKAASHLQPYAQPSGMAALLSQQQQGQGQQQAANPNKALSNSKSMGNGLKAAGVGSTQNAYAAQTNPTSAQRQGLMAPMAASQNSKSSDSLNQSSSGLPKTGKNQLAPKNVSGKLTYEQQLNGYSAQSLAQANSYGQGMSSSVTGAGQLQPQRSGNLDNSGSGRKSMQARASGYAAASALGASSGSTDRPNGYSAAPTQQPTQQQQMQQIQQQQLQQQRAQKQQQQQQAPPQQQQFMRGGPKGQGSPESGSGLGGSQSQQGAGSGWQQQGGNVNPSQAANGAASQAGFIRGGNGSGQQGGFIRGGGGGQQANAQGQGQGGGYMASGTFAAQPGDSKSPEQIAWQQQQQQQQQAAKQQPYAWPASGGGFIRGGAGAGGGFIRGGGGGNASANANANNASANPKAPTAVELDQSRGSQQQPVQGGGVKGGGGMLRGGGGQPPQEQGFIRGGGGQMPQEGFLRGGGGGQPVFIKGGQGGQAPSAFGASARTHNSISTLSTVRSDPHEAKSHASQGPREPSNGNVHSLMNVEDYGGLGPDVWGARYHGMHFPNEQRFVDNNINHFVFNDRDWRPMLKQAPDGHRGKDGSWSVNGSSDDASERALSEQEQQRAHRYVSSDRGIGSTHRLYLHHQEYHEKRTTTLDAICRKIGEVVDKTGGTEVLLAACFKREIWHESGQYRTRTFLTYEEVEQVLRKYGGRVSKEELEYVYMDEFPHGITYSQLVTKVNDVLYTGYTNGRHKFFGQLNQGRRRGHGPAGRFYEFKARMLDHDMSIRPPEDFRQPEDEPSARESLEHHHTKSIAALNDWNSHWGIKQVSKPELFLGLGDGKGKGTFGASMKSGTELKSTVFNEQQQVQYRTAYGEHYNAPSQTHQGSHGQGKRVYPEYEERIHAAHVEQLNRNFGQELVVMEGMDDYDGDPTDWDQKGQDDQLSRNLHSLEVALRCPICQCIMKTAVTLPCGHGFCSTCIRGYMEGRPDECPTCKANKAPPIGRPLAVVRVDRALNDAVEAFRALRPKLLSLLGSAGAKAGADDEEVSILTSSIGSRKRVRRRSSKGMQQEEEDEEWSDSDDGHVKSRGSGSQRRPDSRGGQWWAEKGISKIKYHHATDAMIKRQLEVMGLSTHGGKEKLVLRHSMYMREVDAARDQALLDPNHVKPKSQVIREINVLEKKRDEEASRSSKRHKPTNNGGSVARLPVGRERMFDDLTLQLQRRMREQKAAKVQQGKASVGSRSEEGGKSEEGEEKEQHDEASSRLKLVQEEEEEEEEIVYMQGDGPWHPSAEGSEGQEGRPVRPPSQGPSGSPDSCSKEPPAASPSKDLTSPPASSRPQKTSGRSASQGDVIDLAHSESEEGEGEEERDENEEEGEGNSKGVGPSPTANGKSPTANGKSPTAKGQGPNGQRKSFGLAKPMSLLSPRPSGGMGSAAPNQSITSKARAPPPALPAPSSSDKPWQCYCTLLNGAERDTCDACGAHRVRSTGHRVQEEQLRILKEATKATHTQRNSPRGGSLASALQGRDR